MNKERNDVPSPEREERKPHTSVKQGTHNRRWLFLVVDIVLLAAIVGAVIFLVSLLSPKPLFFSGKDEECKVTYTVELSGVEKSTLNALQVGDTVIDRESGAVIGTVTEVTSRAYEVYTDSAELDPDLDSHVVTKTTYPDDLVTVTVTVTVQADYEKGIGYSVEDCRIAVGRSYDLSFSSFMGEGVCVEFRVE